MEISLLVKLQLRSLEEANVRSRESTFLGPRATHSTWKQEEEYLTCLPDIYHGTMWFPCKSCKKWFKTKAYLLSQEFVPHC